MYGFDFTRAASTGIKSWGITNDRAMIKALQSYPKVVLNLLKKYAIDRAIVEINAAVLR